MSRRRLDEHKRMVALWPSMWLFPHKWESKSDFNLCGHQEESFAAIPPNLRPCVHPKGLQQKPNPSLWILYHFKSKKRCRLSGRQSIHQGFSCSRLHADVLSTKANVCFRGTNKQPGPFVLFARIQFHNCFLILPEGFIKRPPDPESPHTLLSPHPQTEPV